MAIYKLQGIALLLLRYRSTSLLSPTRRFEESRSISFVDRLGCSYPSRLQGQMFSDTPISMAAKNDNMSPHFGGSSEPSSLSESANDGKPPLPSPSPKPQFPVWMRWFVGSILSLLLSAWSAWMPKWSTILRIGGEAEVVLEEVEQVAEVVEKVAAVAEKVAEEVADQLPDQSKLKEATTLVEKVSKEAAKDAHVAEEIIHKVDLVKSDLEDLETLTEPLINKIIHDQNKS